MKLLHAASAAALTICLAAAPARAQDAAPETADGREVIEVTSARLRAFEAGMLADTIEQTEVVDAGDLVSMQANVLSQALVATPGVRVNNECSMCGVKRVMLNGLAGQHTTILIDGLPAHTMVSGFYGPDALSIAGVERIEVARGAGASLTAPEAIGGVINVVTMEPDRTGATFDFAAGSHEHRQAIGLGTFVNDAGTLRALLALQYDVHDQTDEDGNGVSEAPRLENYNISGRLSFDPSATSTLSLRAAYTDSEIFGGPVLGDVTDSITATLDGFDGVGSASLFDGDDVRGRYIGAPWETTEWVATTREELSARYFQELTPALNIDAGVSWSRHEQDSFYEGFDYRADNDMVFASIRANWAIGDSHLVTFGVDRRDEELRSSSDAADGDPAYISDAFDYLTQAVFLQDTWTPTDRLEVALAVRFDHIEADFIDPARPGVEIDDAIVSPRLDLRFDHAERWTSRFSAGRGYRAPLSFFETDHGILDAGQGFIIDVDELERSTSFTYALSYAGDRLTATGALAWTQVENLAALDETDDGVPLLTQRDEDGAVLGATFDLGYRVSDDLSLSFTAEAFEHDDVMRSIFGVAPIEERVIVGAQWAPQNWDIDLTATWIGERDLSDYGYEGYNDAAATIAKPLDAPSYVTVDARVEYALTERAAFYAGARNLFDYTQVDDEDTPLFYDADGGYDVAYIYGPLHGRELYAGVRVEF